MEKLSIPQELKDYINSIINKDIEHSELEIVEVIKRINITYKDCLKYIPKRKVFKYIIYTILEDFYDIYKMPKNLSNEIIEYIINYPDLIRKLSNSEPESEFFSVLKDMLPYYLEFNKNISENNKYETILTYKRIVDTLNEETLGNRTKPELIKECLKRYFFPKNISSTIEFYIDKKQLEEYNEFSIEKNMHPTIHSKTCLLLSNYFHNKMLDYYKKTGFIYVPYNADFNLYVFGNIAVLGYKYDDSFTLSIDNYSSNTIEFWGLLFQGYDHKIKVNDEEIRNKIKFKGKLITAPDDLIEEAYVKYIMHELGEVDYTDHLVNTLNNLHLPYNRDKTDELSTNNYLSYFISPRKFYKWKIKFIEDNPVLQKLLKKYNTDNLDIDNYTKYLAFKYKNLHKVKDPDEFDYYENRKKNPKAWLD